MMAKNNSDQMRKSLVVNEFMENVIFSAFESAKMRKLTMSMKAPNHCIGQRHALYQP